MHAEGRFSCSILLYGAAILAQREWVNSRRWSKLRLWGVLVSVLFCGSIRGAQFVECPPETGLSEHYLKANWRSDDGLPDEIVTALAQTQDGFIWVGTFNGLARFDGVHFKVFNSANTPELKSNRILSLFVDQAGRLWICSEFGDVARLAPNGFRRFGVEDGLPMATVKEFFQEANGQLWGIQHGAWSNYFRVDGDRFSAVQDTVSFDERIRPPRRAKVDDFGIKWHPSWKEGLRIEREGELRTVRYEERSGPEAIRDLMMDMDGNVWVATDTSGLFCFKKRVFTAPNKQPGAGDQMVRSITGDSRGNVWLCASTAVDQMVPSNGGFAARRNVFADLDGPWSVLADGDSVWVGSWGRKLQRFNAATGEVRAEPMPPIELAMLAPFRESAGQMWLGTSAGLFQVRDAEITKFAEGPASADVRAIVEINGDLFVGLNGGGLFAREKGKWSQYGARHGLTDEHIWSLGATRDGHLWVGTVGAGLFRFERGRFVAALEASLPRLITFIIEDDLGYLWLGSNDGLYRAAVAELNACVEGRARGVANSRFDRKDGLPSSTCIGGLQPTAFKDPEGKLWIPTLAGVALVDPQKLPKQRLSAFATIDEVKVDAAATPLRTGAQESAGMGRFNRGNFEPIKVRAGSEQIEIHFTGPDFVAPDRLRLRYRMEGQDSDWLEAGASRAARYSRLAPGEYLFRVVTVNRSGTWNRRGAALGLIVEPHYWQTTWFRCVAVVLAGAALIGAYRYSHWKQNEISRLRLRIASDLHDEVGSNLGSIALKTEMLQAASDERLNRGDLEEINTVALQTANDVRDVAWFINPDFDTLSEMGMRMREVAGRMLGAMDWRFEFEEGLDRKLTLEFRRNVFFIYKETLHNIVKHAQAKRVTIRARDENGMFMLEARDDGRGMGGSSSGGQGRRNMERRAREIDGEIAIESEPGRGTVVRLKAPYRANWFSTYDK